MPVKLPELLIPAGDLSKLRMALAYGADAVYVGASGFSMRPDGVSFSPETLREALQLVKAHGKKLYVAINSMLFDEDIDLIRTWLHETKDIAFDALIVSDAGAFSLIQEIRPEINIHISTQMSTANTPAARFWKKLGAERIVLARECTLAQAKAIAAESGIEVEVFVHGAMCVAVSGRCLLSAYFCGKSGSKGVCKQSCRWEWQLVEQKRPDETIPVFETERETIFLGSKDLCLIEHIPLLVQSGVNSLKVEGRMKNEFYVASVTRAYRAALDSYAKNPDTYTFDPAWLKDLEAISHRLYSTGFAFGYPSDAPDSLQTHNKYIGTALTQGFVEEVSGVWHKISVKNPFCVGDALEWIAPKTPAGRVRIAEIRDEKSRPSERAICGKHVQVRFENDVVLSALTIFRREKEA
ncbi:peptidase U32 [Chloroherpeton thalassium ATCC 35110]|uniref:Peptidase U32 n=1 Tax=Chloroherpeton thalassium (strain ATCC 35110 / GB-78) TaxID=517418 RepID=B3QYJ6_CHLT3|nr:U32 family peptidase C-terminal domain-containing protein [Chloroherpeton thalassium]ACF13624.1 peptidase U32 [Chloroherpeton thalassium ATCC 35110]